MVCAENSEASRNNQYEQDLFHDFRVTINVSENKLLSISFLITENKKKHLNV